METDKHYFIEGLFIIVFAAAAAVLSVWLTNSGHRDDVLYRIYFAESVSGLSVGDTVKFQGVDIGNVKSLKLDTADPQRVEVDVSLRKDAPIKTDTRASLNLKGITGVVFVELSGGSANAQMLAAATPAGQVPQIPADKSTLAQLLDDLPRIIKKFSSIEDTVKKVTTDASAISGRLRDKYAPDKPKNDAGPRSHE
jgi:phospholipid/cholesterol/gamma-HCH transport system substrate-binding protein